MSEIVSFLGEIEAVRQNSYGWVYRLTGGFCESDLVSPEAIMGARRMDDQRQIVGPYKSNTFLMHAEGKEHGHEE